MFDDRIEILYLFEIGIEITVAVFGEIRNVIRKHHEKSCSEGEKGFGVLFDEFQGFEIEGFGVAFLFSIFFFIS